jgi:hypothetical protein
MGRGVHLSSEAERAQARVPGVRRESLHSRRLSRHGGADAYKFAKGTRGPHDRAKGLSVASKKVSKV